MVDYFLNGLSVDIIELNWRLLQERMTKVGVVVPQRLIDGTRNFKDGAAQLLLEELYRHFTGRHVNKVKPAHRVDLSDHAYQVRGL